MSGQRDRICAARLAATPTHFLSYASTFSSTEHGCAALSPLSPPRPFVSAHKAMRLMGEPYASGTELFSFHSVSKGVTGECGLRGGYVQLENIHEGAFQQLYKLASINLCPNTVGQVIWGRSRTFNLGKLLLLVIPFGQNVLITFDESAIAVLRLFTVLWEISGALCLLHSSEASDK